MDNPLHILSSNTNDIAYNYIYIKAYIIDKCNYNCIYCYNKKPRSYIHLDLNRLYEYLQFIYQKTKRNIKLELIGGEPTLHPGLLDFCKKISACSFIKDCTIYSNFSADISLYITLLNIKNITFDMSWHSLPHDTFNKSFLENVSFLNTYFTPQKLIQNVLYLVMYEPLHHLESVIIYKKLLSKKLSQVLLLQVGEQSKLTTSFRYNYTQKQKNLYNTLISSNNLSMYKTTKIIYESGKESLYSDIEMMELNDKNIINLQGWKCNAGIDRIYIHCTGIIYPCQEYYEENITQKYLSIYDNFELITNYQICKCNICGCEWYIKKWKT